MELTFLTSMNRDQLKEFLGGIIKEAIFEGPSDKAKGPIFANPEDEPMVGITEAARITGLAVNTLYDKTYQRAIPHYKKGKRVYFRVSELVAWIATGRVATQARDRGQGRDACAEQPREALGANGKEARANKPTTSQSGRMAIAMQKSKTQ